MADPSAPAVHYNLSKPLSTEVKEYIMTCARANNLGFLHGDFPMLCVEHGDPVQLIEEAAVDSTTGVRGCSMIHIACHYGYLGKHYGRHALISNSKLCK